MEDVDTSTYPVAYRADRLAPDAADIWALVERRHAHPRPFVPSASYDSSSGELGGADASRPPYDV